MSDENIDSTEPVAGPSNALSSAEQLRQRRRQKILANQGSRMDKILGSAESRNTPSSSNKEKVEDPPDETIPWSSLSKAGESIEETEENGVTIIRRKHVSFSDKKDQTEDKVDSAPQSRMTVPATNAPNEEIASTDSTYQYPASVPAGFMITQPDGSTLHPKLSSNTCRWLICLLGAFLSIFNARYFMVTFFSWEVAVLAINGLPDDEAPSSSLILLIALLGMKDEQLRRLKFFLKLFNCFVTDFSVLLVSSLLSRVVIENLTRV